MTPVIVGLLYLAAFIIGSWVALFILTFSRIPHNRLPAFSSGFLAGLIGFTLLPHIFHHYNWFELSLGFLGSLIMVMILHRISHGTYRQHSFSFIALAVALHTIPLSFAIGTVLSDPVASGSLTLVVILHHIPEATALTIWLAGKNGSLNKLFFYFVLLSGFSILIMQAGTKIPNPESISAITIGFSIGVMLLTLLTEANHGNESSKKGNVVYLIAGFIGYGILLLILNMLGIK